MLPADVEARIVAALSFTLRSELEKTVHPQQEYYVLWRRGRCRNLPRICVDITEMLPLGWSSSHFAEAQIQARLTNPAKQNIITATRGSKRQVADIKSEPRPASNRNRWPASYWNAWPASSESARNAVEGYQQAGESYWLPIA